MSKSIDTIYKNNLLIIDGLNLAFNPTGGTIK